jgi:hypothetical protein
MPQSKFKLSVLAGIIFILAIASAALGAQITFNIVGRVSTSKI